MGVSGEWGTCLTNVEQVISSGQFRNAFYAAIRQRIYPVLKKLSLSWLCTSNN